MFNVIFMKDLNTYIIEKLKIKKGHYKSNWDPEHELNISPLELQYIHTLIVVVHNKEVSKENAKLVYDAFISDQNKEAIKGLDNLEDNIIKYLNNHPNLPELLGDTFDDIYVALKSLPEDELIEYSGKNKIINL